MTNTDSIKKVFNVPNLLSMLRIIIIFPFIYYFLIDNYVISVVLIAISGFSDMFDGFIARRFNQITKVGMMLDPVADKLTLLSVVVCLSVKVPIIMPIILVLVVKEVLMLLAGIILLKNHKTPPSAKWYGKTATIVFYISVAVIVILKAVWNIEIESLTITLMCITVVLMLFALVKYFILFLDIMQDSSEKSTINTVK